MQSGLCLTAVALCACLLTRVIVRRVLYAVKYFYGEDRRHAAKAADGFHGFRLVLRSALNQEAVRARLLEMLVNEGAQSMLRIRFASTETFVFSKASNAAVADELIKAGPSGTHDPDMQGRMADELWAAGLPLCLYLDGDKLDLMAHHAVFDGVRGVRLLNDVMGNLKCKGAIRPADLPCCLLACSVSEASLALSLVPLRTASTTGDQEIYRENQRLPNSLCRESGRGVSFG